MASKRETILADLKTDLLTITVANGYNNTVTAVYRSPIEHDEQADTLYPCILVDDFESGREDLEEWTNEDVQGMLLLDLRLYHRDTSAVGDDTWSTTMNGWIEDVKQLLYADRKRGGNADWTRLTRVASKRLEKLGVFETRFSVEIVYHYQADTP